MHGPFQDLLLLWCELGASLVGVWRGHQLRVQGGHLLQALDGKHGFHLVRQCLVLNILGVLWGAVPVSAYQQREAGWGWGLV